MQMLESHNGEKLLKAFLKRIPPSYRDPNMIFAYYASFPMVFNPDMLYQLWLNFQDYYIGNKINILPSVVVSDLLQSGLCDEVAFELYEFDSDVVVYLKENIDSLCDEKQIKLLYKHKDIAAFTLGYADIYLRHPRLRSLFDIYYWKSMFALDPEKATDEVKAILKKEASQEVTSPTDQEATIYLTLASQQAEVQMPSPETFNRLPVFSSIPAPDHIKITNKGLVQQIAQKLGLKSGDKTAEKPDSSPLQYASELIEKAKSERSKALDIGNCGLNGTLPDELFDPYFIENLEWLSLGDRFIDIKTQVHASTSNKGNKNVFIGNEPDLLKLHALKSLRYLYISYYARGGSLSSGAFLKKCQNLKTLCLWGNRFTSFESIPVLPNLEDFRISYNEIKHLSGANKIMPVSVLDLGQNAIEDIRELAGLSNLKKLWLNSNNIKNLSAIIKFFQDKDFFCDLNDNPLETPPLSVAVQGNKSIVDYFRNLTNQINNLNSDFAEQKEERPLKTNRPYERAIDSRGLNIFISYSHKDEAFKEALDAHFKGLKRSGKINTWNDRVLLAGTEWDTEIIQQLENAHIILLLVSANFLASEYIWKEELAHAMKRHNRDEVRVIPIYIKPCDWRNTSFGKLQSLPIDGEPIGGPYDDVAWIAVAKAIRILVDDLLDKGLSHSRSHKDPSVQIGDQDRKNLDKELLRRGWNGMSTKSLKAHLEKLILEANQKDALTILYDWAKDHDRNLNQEVIMLNARFAGLQREINIGLLDQRDAKVALAQITSSLNYLIEKLPDNAKFQAEEGEKPMPFVSLSGQLKILMLTANPAGTTKLNLDKEYSRIAEKIQHKKDAFDLTVQRAVDKTAFRETTENVRPDILHFAGHGEEGGEYGGIIVQNEDRNGQVMITPDGLDALFEYFKGEGIDLKTVVLNACYSQEQAEAIAKHVPYVIGTTVEIGDALAIAFSVGFYFKLAESDRNIEKAFKSGRVAAQMEGAKKSHFVLYKDGDILDL